MRIPEKLTRTVGTKLFALQQHSPNILFGVGIVGVVATAVLASKATLKVGEVLETVEDVKEMREVAEDERTEYSLEEYRKDVRHAYIKTVGGVARLYAPAIGVGVLSVACLTRSHVILTQRNVALTAAYATLEKGFTEYRARVREEVGEDREREIRYEGITVAAKDTNGKTVKRIVAGPKSASIYARFFDQLSTSWQREPEYNLVFLRCQQNYANDMLRARGHLFLNEVYDMLGIPRSKAGSVVGWRISDAGDCYVDFGLYDGNEAARDFVNGVEGAILLDFNVDGVIYDKI